MKNKYLVLPHFLWMVIFIIIPLFLILYFSLTTTVDGKLIFTLDNFVESTKYIGVIVKSIKLAFYCTVICFILGYPIGYILASKQFANKSFLIFLFIVPMWMNFLLRTYAWLTILENNGIINTIISMLGFEKVTLLYTDFSVLLGMVYNYLPFMILPIYTILIKMDNSILEAAEDLGANPREVFTKIVFPLSMPGVISGITMVFMPAVTTFVISNLLGGGQNLLIGNLIEKQFLGADNWNLGSALSILIILLILVTMWILGLLDKNTQGGLEE